MGLLHQKKKKKGAREISVQFIFLKKKGNISTHILLSGHIESLTS